MLEPTDNLDRFLAGIPTVPLPETKPQNPAEICGEERRARQRLNKYGLTEQSFAALYEAQDGCCAICERAMVNPFVDHDHSTGAVRGLLCARCNTGLGQFGDDPRLLKRARRYLERSTQ